MTAWLADRCRMTGGQAGKVAKRARLTGHAPDGTLFDHRTVERLLYDSSPTAS